MSIASQKVNIVRPDGLLDSVGRLKRALCLHRKHCPNELTWKWSITDGNSLSGPTDCHSARPTARRNRTMQRPQHSPACHFALHRAQLSALH
jgi:hypothetical protein